MNKHIFFEKVLSNRTRLSNFRNRSSVTPYDSNLPTISAKDEPPTYNELYINSLADSSESAAKHVINKSSSIQSPEPPPYGYPAQPLTNTYQSSLV